MSKFIIGRIISCSSCETNFRQVIYRADIQRGTRLIGINFSISSPTHNTSTALPITLSTHPSNISVSKERKKRKEKKNPLKISQRQSFIMKSLILSLLMATIASAIPQPASHLTGLEARALLESRQTSCPTTITCPVGTCHCNNGAVYCCVGQSPNESCSYLSVCKYSGL